MLALLSVLSVLAVASAQNATASATDLAIVEAQFGGAQLVPQFIPSFQPEGLLDVTFGSTELSTGQPLEQSAVGEAPTLSIVPGDSATRFTDTTLFTVIMADADIVGTDFAANPQTRHWLVNTVGVQSGESGPYPLNFTGSTAITNYAGPGPAEGSGPHRYVIMVYSQPGAFTPPADLSQPNTPLGTFQVQEYVNSTGLGALVAANYFTVENGQATVSVIATSSVDTATISVASTSNPVSQPPSSSGSATMSMSGSGSPASSSAAASNSGNSAPGSIEMGWGMIVGAVGVAGAVLGAGLV